jgi:hypothetical protein
MTFEAIITGRVLSRHIVGLQATNIKMVGLTVTTLHRGSALPLCSSHMIPRVFPLVLSRCCNTT